MKEYRVVNVVLMIPVNDLKMAPENDEIYMPFNIRNDNDMSLALSINKDGVTSPIEVTEDGYIASGHRRFSAAKACGLREVPCIQRSGVVYANMTAVERLVMLKERNAQRIKSFVEERREAALTCDGEQSYQEFKKLREKQEHVNIESNVFITNTTARVPINTIRFLNAAVKVINDHKPSWPLTVRRVHYLLLNNPPARNDSPKSKLYDNTAGDYEALSDLLVRARAFGYIPMECLTDELREASTVTVYDSASEYLKNEIDYLFWSYRRDLLRGQENHVEIILEKNAIRTHIEKVAREYYIPCTVSRGMTSFSTRYDLVKRFKDSKKKNLVILFLTDLDPAGDVIAESVVKSLAMDFGQEVHRAVKVCITPEDVKKHNIFSKMIPKGTTKEAFLKKYGKGAKAYELDAMRTEDIQENLRNAIESVLDMDAFRAEFEREKQDNAQLMAEKRAIISMMRR